MDLENAYGRGLRSACLAGAQQANSRTAAVLAAQVPTARAARVHAHAFIVALVLLIHVIQVDSGLIGNPIHDSLTDDFVDRARTPLFRPFFEGTCGFTQHIVRTWGKAIRGYCVIVITCLGT